MNEDPIPSCPIPDTVQQRLHAKLPRHVAIIMDGNGRWAERKSLPRYRGHQAGVEAVRAVVQYAAKHSIEVLTLFAFSSENWRRPPTEVSRLLDLLTFTLEREVRRLHEQSVLLRFIGDRSPFPKRLQQLMFEAESKTQNNAGLKLVIAVNYGGRWEIVQAVQSIARWVAQGRIHIEDIDESLVNQSLSLTDLPEPDLFIRTGGEQRISNFLLWQLAYTEFYFTDCLWPDFDHQHFEAALDSYATRQRRFGLTGHQVEEVRRYA